MDDLAKLAELIKIKNDVDCQISRLVGRPALIGHVGEYIAAKLFDIRLVESASMKSIDGYFQSGVLAGKSVNVKWYAKQEGILDITPAALPDYYLVLSGPFSHAKSSRGTVRPWMIDRVVLFHAAELVEKLRFRGVKIGVATSVPKMFWEEAEIYPRQNNNFLLLTDEHRRLLALFGTDAQI